MCTHLALVAMNKIDYRFYYKVYSLVREADVQKYTHEYEYIIINYDKCHEWNQQSGMWEYNEGIWRYRKASRR